jgi:hypothetical protein
MQVYPHIHYQQRHAHQQETQGWIGRSGARPHLLHQPIARFNPKAPPIASPYRDRWPADPQADIQQVGRPGADPFGNADRLVQPRPVRSASHAQHSAGYRSSGSCCAHDTSCDYPSASHGWAWQEWLGCGSGRDTAALGSSRSLYQQTNTRWSNQHIVVRPATVSGPCVCPFSA